MTEFVKDFIENFIEIIEEKQWSRVIEEWMYEADEFEYYDNSDFTELCEVLEIIDPLFIENTKEARESIIKKTFDNNFFFHVRRSEAREIPQFYKEDIMIDDRWFLGFKKDEVEKLMHEVAANYNLSYDDDTFYLPEE